MMETTEHQIQVAFTEWLNWKALEVPKLKSAFAIPNGGQRHPAVAKKLKAEGVKPGIPDYCFPFPNKFHSGLFLEFKTKKGAVSEKQGLMMALLCRLGNYCAVVRSFEEAQTVLLDYLADRI